MKYIYIQDDFVNATKAFLPVGERGQRFGDGIFETIRVENGHLYNWDFHLSRLMAGLEAIKIKYKTGGLPAKAAELTKRNKLKNGFLRLSVSRGVGSKGYMPDGAEPLLVIETIDGFTPPPAKAKLWISTYNAHTLAPAKTMNALNYTLALMEAAENGCDNALMVDGDGNICETASGNIFWFEDGILHTPSDDLNLIPGSIRERILALYDGEIRQGKFGIEDISPTEMFMTNVNCLVMPFTEMFGVKLKTAGTNKIKKLVQDDIAKLG